MGKGLWQFSPEVAGASSFLNMDSYGPRGKISTLLPAKVIQRDHIICYSRAFKDDDIVLFNGRYPELVFSIELALFSKA